MNDDHTRARITVTALQTELQQIILEVMAEHGMTKDEKLGFLATIDHAFKTERGMFTSVTQDANGEVHLALAPDLKWRLRKVAQGEQGYIQRH